jgi:hypothetical protein
MDAVGSKPTRAINQHVRAEQPGVLATLSRWRSGVQIPSGTLFLQQGAVFNPAKRRSSNLRGLWVRLPLASSTSIALAEHWRAQVAVTHPPSGFGGSTPSRRIHFQFLSSRVGQCPSGPHKPRTSGATPGPAISQTETNGRVRKQEKRRGRGPRDSVGSIPTSVTDNTIPWSNGNDTCPTCRRRWFNSIGVHSMVCRCFGSTRSW